VIVDRGYLDTVDGVCLLPGAGDGLAALAAAGYALVLVSNQSGIGRGYYGRAVVDAQHDRLASLLEPYGVRFAAIEVCPHAPADACACRKPHPELLVRAARRLGLDLQGSFMVGDKLSDVRAGQAAGCRTVFLGAERPAGAEFCAPGLRAAATVILGAWRKDEG